MSTILLATDGSPAARRATDVALELARAAEWPLRIVVVWRIPVIAGYGYVAAAMVPDLSDAERERATTIAEETCEHAREAGVSATFQVRAGDAADEICAAAEEVDAKLVVMGAHGWGAVKRFLFGSVSTRVLHEAPCGVLVVRAPAEESAEEAGRAEAVASL